MQAIFPICLKKLWTNLVNILKQKLSEKFKGTSISILMGGWSSERDISLKTGQAVLNAMKELDLKVEALDLTSEKQAYENLKELELVFIALHGRGGEDGFIQKILEDRKIKYTGSDSEACKLAMNKCETKKIWRELSLPTPDFVEIKNAGKNEVETFPFVSGEEDVASLDKSFVVKPAREGSSVGVSIVHPGKGSLEEAMQKAINYDDTLIIEAFIEGEEITVPILGERALAAITIKPNRDFYDFEAKYLSNETEYFPSKLSTQEIEDVKEFSWHAFSCLGCSGWGRVDLIKDKQGNFQLLEINTAPGLTKTSLVPKSAKVEGLSFNELIISILNTA